MAKTYLSTVKYVIRTDFTIEGIVDKHDIIGAIFGQSEGLIGEEMDLKELQKNGKLGRIEVDAQTKSGKTVGTLMIPSSLDRVQTSILAAAIESVDKVGPCNSSFKTATIEDARQEKRKTVTERAKELLMQMTAGMPETQEIAETIKGKARTADLREIGRDKIPIGPEVDSSHELILVEGRADVINLLKHGIKNVAGIGGAKVTRTVINLARGKEVTLFVDGDRGGEIIVRQLGQAMKLDFVAKAPDGKEVEELTLKEILSSLRKKGSLDQQPYPTKPEFGTRETRPARTGYRGTSPRDTGYRDSAPSPRGTGYRDSAPSPRGTGYKGSSPDSRGTGYRDSDTGPRDTGYRSQGRTREGGYRSQGKTREGGYRSREKSFGERRDRPSFRPRSGPGRRPSPRDRDDSFAKEFPLKPNDLGPFSKEMQGLEGSLKARFLDDKMKATKEVNVRDLLKEMQRHKGASAIVLDGIITKRLLEEAKKNKVKQLVGVKKGKIEESKDVKVSTLY